MRWWLAVVLLLVVGCSKKKPPPLPDPARCRPAVEHAVAESAALLRDYDPERITILVYRHCVEDRWDEAMVRCVETSAGPNAVFDCNARLPAAQASLLKTALTAPPTLDDYGGIALTAARRVAAVAKSGDCDKLMDAINAGVGPDRSKIRVPFAEFEAKYGAQLEAIITPARDMLATCKTPAATAMLDEREREWATNLYTLYRKVAAAAKTAGTCDELGSQLARILADLRALRRFTPISLDEKKFEARYQHDVDELIEPATDRLFQCEYNADVKAFIAAS